MAVQIEIIVKNGREFTRTYSDEGYLIERDGIKYAEAIDPADSGREYMETSEYIEGYSDEATEADYLEALARLGVE